MSDRAHADDPWSRVSPRVLLLGVLLLSALLYLPTLTFAFVYDDHWTLLANGFLRQPGDLPRLLGPSAHAAHVPDAFRPTLVAFDTASYWLLGVDPWRHHAVSVLLHVSVVAAMATWLRRLGAPTALWASSAALFGVMAIHAEAVAVVSFHEDLLAAGLGMAALVLADGSGRARGTGSMLVLAAASAVLMALAAGAKLNAIALVGLWVLARGLAPWGRSLGARDLPGALGLLVGASLALAHRLAIYGGPSPYGDDPRIALVEHGPVSVLARSVQIHVGYLQQMVLPFGLSPEYVEPPDAWTSIATLVCAPALLGLLGLGLHAAWRRRHPVLALAVLGAIGLALPTSNLWPMPNLRADRLMYLPSIPVAVGLAALLLGAGRTWASRVRAERADQGGGEVRALAPLLTMLILQGALAQGASTIYRSDLRLWETALRHAPGSARAHAILGELYVAQLGDAPNPDPKPLTRASTHCTMAQHLAPRQALPWLCEARVAVAAHDWARAYDRFTRALELGMPRRDRVLTALASVVLDHPDLPYEDRTVRAREFADRAIREYPYSALAAATAAGIHHRLGDAAAARELYARARKLRPERWDLVLAGVELELDLGHASAARAAWAASKDLLEGADPTRRDHVRRRLADAERLAPRPYPLDSTP
ncbi:hypothetical protein [Paraliomyxa miuraensis]|uniref:hypothetical protein n=1 Tax=Paraliomyxa miuraensis TaxID=376150 RepID=UPI0022569337|nr:hypothetical protein [Paraliomyxa miuraensis]MCX4243684.1 hypothetical protein [Paraliomyxa miuraensis]